METLPDRCRMLAALALIVAIGAPLALPAQGVQARTTITVTTSADELNRDGDCSLREALRAANRDIAIDDCAAGSGDDLIVLPTGFYRLSRSGAGEETGRTGDLDILTELTISGAGADRTVIDGMGADRVFDIDAEATATIAGVRIQNGADLEALADLVAYGHGGGVRNFGSLTILDSFVIHNRAGQGGGVANVGTLTLRRSLIGYNSALDELNGCEPWRDQCVPGQGGGIASAGVLTISESRVVGNAESGLYNSGVARVERSTFAANSSATFGGAIWNVGALELVGATISGNSAVERGGGIYSTGPLLVAGSTIVRNGVAGGTGGGVYQAGGQGSAFASIIADNTVAVGMTVEPDDCAGLASAGANLVERPCGPDGPGDVSGLDPLLGPLQDNGGPTPTHLPRPGSPARDAVAACEAVDQRGVGRPQGELCDIGAVELEVATAPYPATRLRDEFSRRFARLSPAWAGEGRSGYNVSSGALAVGAGGPAYWLRERFGPTQEAYITLRALDGGLHGLLLKVRRSHGVPNWREGAIRVSADGAGGRVLVEAHRRATGWRTLAEFAVPVAPGDMLGARALSDGTVEVYLNEQLLGTTDTREAGADFFVGVGGYIGLWFEDAPAALADDFGGGALD